MIKRISMWKLKDRHTADQMKAALLSMKGNVPSLMDIEVGLNFSVSKSAYDIVFTGLFKDKDALEEFENDPFHKAVGQIVDGLKESRKVVDFEVKD